jgi:cyclopropane fatty-acyl-phospholipid synthase-like methyltransferase
LTTIDFFDRVYKAHARYWHHANRDSTDARDFPEPWRRMLRRLADRPPGRALDLGAGEGADVIRLARLGYQVDAVEGSAVAADKIRAFAREACVRINVIHADIRSFQPTGGYDVVICSGLLHYLKPEQQSRVLSVLKAATAPGGLNLVTTFTDRTPVPDCHRVLEVFPDHEEGMVAAAYRHWKVREILERDKPESTHRDFPPHRHSFIKVLAQRPEITTTGLLRES